MIEPPAGLTHLGRCGLPPVRLVVENTRSWEWISPPRREPRRARDRLAPLRPSTWANGGVHIFAQSESVPDGKES
jgi:hypothetical protein